MHVFQFSRSACGVAVAHGVFAYIMFACSMIAWGMIAWGIAQNSAAAEPPRQPDATASENRSARPDTRIPFAPVLDHIEIQPVITSLNSPCSVAVRPGGTNERHEIFVADRDPMKLIKVTLNGDEPSEVDFITGFDESAPGQRPAQLELLFLDHHTLVVGGTSQGGEGVVRLYKLPAGENAIAANDARQQIQWNPPPADAKAEVRCYGLAANEYTLFVTAGEPSTNGWILEANIQRGVLGELRPLLPDQYEASVKTPLGVAVNPKPGKHYLVVGQAGARDVREDSVLTFCNPQTGEVVSSFATGLFDITDLAYSPVTGFLYAVDFAWMAEDRGGIYRLDATIVDGRQACRAVPVASVLRPTGMAFAPDGVLYVTALGNTDGTQKDQGALLKITGQL